MEGGLREAKDGLREAARIIPDGAGYSGSDGSFPPRPEEDVMSEATHAMARRWMHEVWNERREATIDELMAPDGVGHIEGGEVIGPGPFREYRAAMLATFPDLRLTVEDSLADADSVVVRWKATGTHRGDALGVPATGREVAFSGMTWFRVADGRFVEGWDAWNMGGLLASLAS